MCVISREGLYGQCLLLLQIELELSVRDHEKMSCLIIVAQASVIFLLAVGAGVWHSNITVDKKYVQNHGPAL